MRGRRMVRKQIEDRQSVFHASTSGYTVAEYDFLAWIMNPRLKLKTSLAPWLTNGPTGKAAGDFLNVLLDITAVDAKGMEFHQLASIILIQPAAPVIGRKSRAQRIRTSAEPIVEIKEHRRTLGGGAQ